jgi:cobalt-precorrin-7 (C5)-methyltransferase
MAHQLIVAGIGPGSREYMLPKAAGAIRNARYLAGSRRALEDYAGDGQQTCPITGKLGELKKWIGTALLEDDVVVMVSGDPGYYSLLPWLKREFPKVSLEVIPGISAVQAAFCRVGEPWQDADLLSFHGRVPPEEKLAYSPGRVLSFLTDGIHNPAYICRCLLDHGWPEASLVSVLEHISYPGERRRDVTLAEGRRIEGFNESVMVVRG